jgi:hypothetical protein
MKRIILLTAVFALLFGAAGTAPVGAEETFDPDLDYAQVREVEIERNSGGGYNVSVTVRHADEGWDHFADRWEIVHPETKEVIVVRELLHPHTNEQPFTRSLTEVELPDDLDSILVRARCNLHGFEGRQIMKKIPAE